MNADNPILRELGSYLSDTLQTELLQSGYLASEELSGSIESLVERTLSGVEISASVHAGAQGISADALIEGLRRRKSDLRGRRAESAGFAKRSSIQERAIRPASFIDRAARKIERSARVDAQVEKYLAQLVEEQLQTMFNQLSA